MMQLRKQGLCLRCFTPSALLLVGLSQFVPLQISKIEPICVAAWAAATIIRAPPQADPSMPVVMPRLVMKRSWLDIRL
jgi:hypothetical protein